jgi:hypothetical protein
MQEKIKTLIDQRDRCVSSQPIDFDESHHSYAACCRDSFLIAFSTNPRKRRREYA